MESTPARKAAIRGDFDAHEATVPSLSGRCN
jgi:hypothetical protein